MSWGSIPCKLSQGIGIPLTAWPTFVTQVRSTCQCESCRSLRSPFQSSPLAQALNPWASTPDKVIYWSSPREMNEGDLGLPEKVASDTPYSFWLGREPR